MAALIIPKQTLQSAAAQRDGATTTPSWELSQDDERVVGGSPAEAAARMQRDLTAWYTLFGEAPLVPDTPIPDAALDLALAVFSRLFTTEKIQQKARLALETIIRAAIYTIAADGSLHVLASSGRSKQSSYTVTAYTSHSDDAADSGSSQVSMACGCKDFYARAHEHGGICKHIAARLLLFLAQRGVAALHQLRDTIDREATLPPSITSSIEAADAPCAADEDAMAFVRIPASDLAAALFLALRSTAPVELRAKRGRLHLVGSITDLSLGCLDGSGTAAVSLETTVLRTLYNQLCLATTSADVMTLFVEALDGSVYVCSQGEAFSAEASGTPIINIADPLI